MRMNETSWLAVSAAVFLTACATIKTQGAVTPLGGGQFKSFVKASDEARAMKMLDNDAKLTCKQEKGSRFDPLTEGKYVVVSQQTAKKDAPQAKTDNKIADAAITLSSLGGALRAQTEFTATTVFKCD